MSKFNISLMGASLCLALAACSKDEPRHPVQNEDQARAAVAAAHKSQIKDACERLEAADGPKAVQECEAAMATTRAENDEDASNALAQGKRDEKEREKLADSDCKADARSCSP